MNRNLLRTLMVCAFAGALFFSTFAQAAPPKYNGSEWQAMLGLMQRTDSGVGKIWKQVKLYGAMSDTIRVCTSGNYIFVTDIDVRWKSVTDAAPDDLHFSLFNGVSQTDSLWTFCYNPQFDGFIPPFSPQCALPLSADSSLVLRNRPTAAGAADTLYVTVCGFELPAY